MFFTLVQKIDFGLVFAFRHSYYYCYDFDLINLWGTCYLLDLKVTVWIMVGLMVVFYWIANGHSKRRKGGGKRLFSFLTYSRVNLQAYDTFVGQQRIFYCPSSSSLFVPACPLQHGSHPMLDAYNELDEQQLFYMLFWCYSSGM